MMDFRIWMLPLLCVFGFLIYAWNLQALNAYRGLLPIDIDISTVVIFLSWMILAVTITPRKIRRPTDLMLIFYVVICFLWGALLWPVTGFLSEVEAIVMMLLLYIPGFALIAGRKYIAPRANDFLRPIYAARPQFLWLPLVVALTFGAFAVMAVFGAGDLGIDNVYDRRLAGRDALSDYVWLGYVINMSANGVAPLLAFIAGRNRSPLLFAVVGAFVVLLFWKLGLKSPAINIVMLATLGFAFGMKALSGRIVILFLGLATAVFSFVLYKVSDGSYSAIADYLIRRIVVVQPQLQTYYVHEWLRSPWDQRLFGVALGEYMDWSFLIGDRYLGNVLESANTNGFLYALLRRGLLGYVLAIVIVVSFGIVVDAFYGHTYAPEFFAIAAIYGILVSEQSCTTAFLSSGVALCLVITMLFSHPPRVPRVRPAGGWLTRGTRL